MVNSVRKIAGVIVGNRHAATSIEYTMIAALIALVVVGGYAQIGSTVNGWLLSVIAGF
ncbi:MAG: Flp family type IVb pilin [Rhodospirillaceae bacterium]